MKAFTSKPDAVFTLHSVNLMRCKTHSQVPYFWVFSKNLPLESWLYVFETVVYVLLALPQDEMQGDNGMT